MKGLNHNAVDQVRNLINRDHVKGDALREYIKTHLDDNCDVQENRELINDMRSWGHLETARSLETIISSEGGAPGAP